MNRVVIVCAVAAALIVAGVAIYRQRVPQPNETITVIIEQAADPTGSQREGPASVPEQPAAAPEDTAARRPPHAAAEPRPPSFDAVRVGEDGSAVIAGRAAPRAEVVVLDGEKELGRVTADQRGDFVFVPERSLDPGSRQLGLRMERGGDGNVESEDVVVLVVPEAEQDIAGRPAGENPARQRPLALLVPRDEAGATRVLQAPAAPSAFAETPPSEEPPVTATATAAPRPEPKGRPVEEASGGPSDPVVAERTAADIQSAISIDVVDYDEAGELVVTGRAAPQSEVRLYLDNDLVGTGAADAEGAFSVRPQKRVDIGTYRMRVDQLDGGGTVISRAETPFSRADPATLNPGPGQVVVQPGNSLWRIARRIYGDGLTYTVIYQANQGQIRNPDLIYPGQIFSLPEYEEPTDPG